MDPERSLHVPETVTEYVSPGSMAKPLGFHLSPARTVKAFVGAEPGDGCVPVHYGGVGGVRGG